MGKIEPKVNLYLMVVTYKITQARPNSFQAYYNRLEEDEYDSSNRDTAMKGSRIVTEANHDLTASRVNFWLLATISNRI